MALCGMRCGRLRSLFKWLVNCIHKIFLQIWNKWIVVSSSHLQKEYSKDLILLNWKSFFLGVKHCVKFYTVIFLFCKSVVAILGKI